MLELDGLVALVLLGLWLFCLFDVITSPADQIRNLPKPLWIMLVIILSDVGSIMWLIAGRPRVSVGGAQPRPQPYRGSVGNQSRAQRARPGGRSIAPDDNPEFLRQLGTSNAEHESMLNQWEADLRRREQELRDKPPESDGPTV